MDFISSSENFFDWVSRSSATPVWWNISQYMSKLLRVVSSSMSSSFAISMAFNLWDFDLNISPKAQTTSMNLSVSSFLRENCLNSLFSSQLIRFFWRREVSPVLSRFNFWQRFFIKLMSTVSVIVLMVSLVFWLLLSNCLILLAIVFIMSSVAFSPSRSWQFSISIAHRRFGGGIGFRCKFQLVGLYLLLFC